MSDEAVQLFVMCYCWRSPVACRLHFAHNLGNQAYLEHICKLKTELSNWPCIDTAYPSYLVTGFFPSLFPKVGKPAITYDTGKTECKHDVRGTSGHPISSPLTILIVWLFTSESLFLGGLILSEIDAFVSRTRAFRLSCDRPAFSRGPT